MDADDEILPLEALEPFGWVFTQGPLPPGGIPAEAARVAVGALEHDTSILVSSGRYTEKGRYREEQGERRTTLYLDFPVWVVTIVTGTAHSSQETRAQHFPRHTVVDAQSGRPLTEFLRWDGSVEIGALDLHAPLTEPAMTASGAEAAAAGGEERVLAGLPRTVEYGSRWRLLPGFAQVTDIWRVTFDTSTLPAASPSASPEFAWVVLVDDKAGHRWMSAAVTALDQPQP